MATERAKEAFVGRSGLHLVPECTACVRNGSRTQLAKVEVSPCVVSLLTFFFFYTCRQLCSLYVGRHEESRVVSGLGACCQVGLCLSWL